MNIKPPDKKALLATGFYFLLAAPAIFMPLEDYMSMNRTRFQLGLLIPIGDLLVGDCFGDGRLLHFQPAPVLPLAVAVWTGVAAFLWNLRRRTKERGGVWSGAIQAVIASAYCVLVFFFLFGITAVVWERVCDPMDMAALERVFILKRHALPALYVLGLCAIMGALLLDARKLRGMRRGFHYGCMLLFAGLSCWLLPLVNWQLKDVDESIQHFHDQQKK